MKLKRRILKFILKHTDMDITYSGSSSLNYLNEYKEVSLRFFDDIYKREKEIQKEVAASGKKHELAKRIFIAALATQLSKQLVEDVKIFTLSEE